MFDLIINIVGNHVSKNVAYFFVISSSCCLFCCASIRLVRLLDVGPKVDHLENFGHLAFPDKVSFMVLQLFHFLKYDKGVECRAFNLNLFGHCDRWLLTADVDKVAVVGGKRYVKGIKCEFSSDMMNVQGV